MRRLHILNTLMNVMVAAIATPYLAAESSVHVHVTDAYGTQLPMAQIAIATGNSEIRLKQDEEVQLKNGSYTVRVEVPGFSPAVVPVVVDQPKQVFAIAMRLGDIEGNRPFCTIAGRVEPEEAPLRLKLLELYGAYFADVPLGMDGAFAFRNLECGTYLLVAIGPSGCRGTAVLVAKSAQSQMDFALPKSSSKACTTIPIAR